MKKTSLKKLISAAIITGAIAALGTATAISSSAESAYNIVYDHAGDKEGPGFAEYELLGADGDAGAKINEDGLVAGAEGELHAVQGHAETKAGDKDVNVHAEIIGTAGAARGSASIGAGLDENGKIKAGAELGGELLAGEVSGKVGYTAGGIEVNATGALKVGVGVKAKCGIEDGKLKVELGASLGLGAEVGFEIDPSKMNLKPDGKALKEYVAQTSMKMELPQNKTVADLKDLIRDMRH